MSNPAWLQELFDEHDAEMVDIGWAERQRARTAQVKKNVQKDADVEELREELAQLRRAITFLVRDQSGSLLLCGGLPRGAVAQQQPSTSTQKGWDAYVDGRINKAVNKAVDNLFDATAEAFSIERKRLRDEIAALREELILRIDAIKFDSTVRGHVIDLLKFVPARGKRNAA